MSPLIDEYFKRDLTEAEEKQLADILTASPEDALRLSEGLGEMYQKSGLPTPVWPGGTLPPFEKSTGWVKPLIPTALILLLFGFSAYKWFSRVPAPQAEPITSPAPVQPEMNPVRKPKALSHAVEKIQKQASNPGSAHPAAAANANPISDSSLELPSLQTAPSSSLPVPQPQGHLYQQLSVVVEPTVPSLATVRVLDGGNHELKTLYAGIIPAGRRTFTWDGKTTNGVVAPAGTYYIEVKSGQKVMRQEVKVEGN